MSQQIVLLMKLVTIQCQTMKILNSLLNCFNREGPTRLISSCGEVKQCNVGHVLPSTKPFKSLDLSCLEHFLLLFFCKGYWKHCFALFVNPPLGKEVVSPMKLLVLLLQALSKTLDCVLVLSSAMMVSLAWTKRIFG